METTADIKFANSVDGVAARALAVLTADQGEFRTIRRLAVEAQAPEALVLLALPALRAKGVLVGNVGGPDVVWLPRP